MQVKRKQRVRKFDKFKEIVKKAVDAEVRATFRSCSYARNIDQYRLQGSWLSAAKTNTQDQLI